MPKDSSRKPEDRIEFRKHDRVGSNGAEEDTDFLAHCFVDTGDLDLLLDSGKPQRVVIGRTGAGKTALLRKVLEQERSVEIKPENLALSFISNSTVIQFFEALGVSLEPFYKLIWRHAFCVELLRMRFGLEPGEDVSWWERVKAFFKRGQYASALRYIENWHDKFWQETEVRIKELTQKVERSLTGGLKDLPFPVPLNVEAAEKLTKEQRAEVVHRAQKVVNDAHVPQLNQIVEIVDGVLDDPKQIYFLVIDRLDEEWVDDNLRYRLIMALLETVRDFKRVKNAKIIVSVRVDLIRRVFTRARPAGFQEEKYASLFLRLRWSREALKQLLDERIQHLFRDRYVKSRQLTHRDILVGSRRQVEPIDYMLGRTLERPRDLIAFFNQCLAAVEGKSRIAMKDIYRAEREYSSERLQSLQDEWFVDYPYAADVAKLLFKGLRASAQLDQLRRPATLDAIANALMAPKYSSHPVVAMALQACDGPGDAILMIREMVCVFYRMGLLGLKLSPASPVSWFDDTGQSVTPEVIHEGLGVEIHPMFRLAVGCVEEAG